MIRVDGEPAWKWHLRISWWHRMKLKLWLHFLPHRILCRFLGHRWNEASPSITVGPLHLPPDERSYHVLAYTKSCVFCARRLDVPLMPEREFELIQEAEAEDWEEWNNPEIRSALEALGE